MDFQIVIEIIVQSIKSNCFFIKEVRNIMLLGKVLKLAQNLLQILFLLI